MGKPWTVVQLGEVVTQIERNEPVDAEREYRLLGMRSRIGGPFLRETKLGGAVAASTLNRVASGDFIYSRLFAWQGSFGVIPNELDGCYVSNEFPIFRVDEKVADSRFLVYWFGLPAVQKRVEADCCGSTPGTRNRYKEIFFQRLRVSLPPLEEQHRIVARLDQVERFVQARQAAIDAMDADAEAMLRSAFDSLIDGAPLRSMAEIAPLVRRPVEIFPERSYPELGVRSFGRGTFHKPPLSGAEVGTKKLFFIKPGDLVFNIVFAWEGAVAVATESDEGRVGSHRFLTCVPHAGGATAEFLRFYFLTPEGLAELGKASPGGAGRNRTLGLKSLEAIQVPTPSLDKQLWFDRLQAKVREIWAIREQAARDANALLPAMLHEIFGNGGA